MSKQVHELLQEFIIHSDISDDYQVHVLKVIVDEAGEIEQTGDALPVTHIEIDSDDNECLLHYATTTDKCISVKDVKAFCNDSMADFEVCAAQEKQWQDSVVRMDTPLIGFGENTELKCFFIICQK